MAAYEVANEFQAFSLSEVSKLTGLSIGHLRNESRRGRLRLLKSGRRTLITAIELRRYLESCGDRAVTNERTTIEE